MKTGALILAAGLSSRMGEFKPLLELAGKKLIERNIEPFVQFGCDPVLVVTGREADVLEKFLTDKFAGQICFVRNPAYAVSDMFASVKLGIQSLTEVCDDFFLIPADIPLIAREILGKMAAETAPVVRPSYRGKVGHPVLLRKNAAKRVLAYEGALGLKGALRSEPQAFVEVDTPGILLDADTPEDFRAIENFLRSQQV